MYRFRKVAALWFALASLSLFASVVGSVRGIVHDPHHHPLEGATITLSARGSDYHQSASTNGSGEFAFPAVPAGEYEIKVEARDFQIAAQTVQVTANSAPVLHF